MNQRGFATVLSLCLILVIALIVRGINAAEKNHAYETMNFSAEIELQNAAESAICAAIAQVNSGVTLPEKNSQFVKRQDYQSQFPAIKKNSARLGTIIVETWGENMQTIQSYKVSYNVEDDDEKALTENIAKKKLGRKKQEVISSGKFFFSVAQATNPITGEKMFRRAAAYITDNDATIHFMDVKQSDYTFEK